MELSTSEKLKIIMKRENVTMSELAKRIGQSRQNITNKVARNSFSEEEFRQIAEILGYEYVTEFRRKD